MDPKESVDPTRIGIDDDAWQATLSRDAAQSLLRMCSAPGVDERTYTNVQLLSVPNGSNLYIKSFA